jgi:SAM-dependent methyltransferase
VAKTNQAQYWDTVAENISQSDLAHKDLVGYQAPYDVYARRIAVAALERFCALVPDKSCVAELGSGAGLNLRYFSKLGPKKLLAFDCSPRLLGLAKANLADLHNVDYIQTNASNLPVPAGQKIDLLFTVTVLQHITDPQMFEAVTTSMKDAKPQYILIHEATSSIPKLPMPEYILRTPDDYFARFQGAKYELVASDFVSLTWAARLFGGLNKLFGLYGKHEGARLPSYIFAANRLFSPLVTWLDKLLPGKFGMTTALFKLKPAHS